METSKLLAVARDRLPVPLWLGQQPRDIVKLDGLLLDPQDAECVEILWSAVGPWVHLKQRAPMDRRFWESVEGTRMASRTSQIEW